MMSDLCGDFDQFEEIDDDILCTIPLDYDSQGRPGTAEQEKVASNVPEEFSFPFTPYDIQVGFMKSLYETLDQGKIGIFESPTGTGKSLSLICGALRWLKDFEEQQRKELEELLQEKQHHVNQSPVKQAGGNELDWIAEFAKKQEEMSKKKTVQEEQKHRKKIESRLEALKKSYKPKQDFKRKRDKLDQEFEELLSKEAQENLKADLENVEIKVEPGVDNDEDNELVLAEYMSEDEKADDNEQDNSDGEEEHVTKIYYCSRTHSQLAQFVREVIKSPHGEDTRVISIGSRQNLCINDTVKKLRSLTLMNDRCIELQKNKKKSEKKTTEDGDRKTKRKKSGAACPFYKQDPMMAFRDAAMVEIKDIEQLVTMGRQMKACPYYGTRYSLPGAQVVVLPYNTLLHKSTRESCGIKLKGNVVIVDEAHNLVETISNVHSVQVTGAQLICAHSQLTQYQDRYKSRLKAKNLMYIRQLLFLLSSLIKCLGGKTNVPADQQKIDKQDIRLRTINDFLFDTQLDNFNLFKVKRYCERSMIARKLHGFCEKHQPSVVVKTEEREEKPPMHALSKLLQNIQQGKDVNDKSPTKENTEPEQDPSSSPMMSSPLMQIESFMEALTNADKDGRIVVNRQELLSKCSIKFLLLNPAVHFADIVSEARAVVVAGGTMQPLDEFKDQLFYAAGVQPERILEYACGHVIEKDQILPLALARGSSGFELDFTYQSRDKNQTMDELGRVVYQVCNLTPGGVVVFFPSYEYEKNVYSYWEKAGYLEKISAKKRIFREPKQACQVDQILSEYSTCIEKHINNKYSQYTGAALFCVVGGKMSEGINFSDHLGRCVIMVGLPYPNIRSPELKEKMDYLNENHSKSRDGRLPGQIHYENLCMKAVNQSIGRAIRHKGDYACILLLDHRYLRPSMKNKLPGWISGQLKPFDRFGPALIAIKQFFQRRKELE